MKVIKSFAKVYGLKPYREVLSKLANAARVAHDATGEAYTQAARFEEDERLVRRLIQKGHESVLEHDGFSLWICTDRAIANELTRHRHIAVTQQSTRHCAFSELEVIRPAGLPADVEEHWRMACAQAWSAYRLVLSKMGEGNGLEVARSILPLCTATHLVITANWREWRHIFRLRLADNAHPDMRALLWPVWAELLESHKVLMEDCAYFRESCPAQERAELEDARPHAGLGRNDKAQAQAQDCDTISEEVVARRNFFWRLGG